ncbi:MAG TPA: ABC transporter permease [Rectinemataceae bacterium]|nr:ABC transporter permease [Rectinemataceae bacterium]
MNIVYSMLPIAFAYASPLIIAALGGMFSERSGIVNIALEGIMMVGAFTAASITVVLEPITPLAGYWGLLAGIVAGVLYSLLHAFASVNLKADQVVSGTAVNILAGGLTVYLAQIFFQQQRTRAFSTGLVKITIPGLADIPLLGPLFFKNVSPPFYIAIILVFLAWFVVFKTPFGLRLRSCGEHPQAAASMGINVFRYRYAGVMISGALAGLAGGALDLTQDIQFSAVSIHGSGFIALACLIFGKWNPFGVLGAGLFFGLSQALSIFANDIPFLKGVPLEFFYLLPYALTIVALLVFSGKSVGPKAAGEIYDAGKR